MSVFGPLFSQLPWLTFFPADLAPRDWAHIHPISLPLLLALPSPSEPFLASPLPPGCARPMPTNMSGPYLCKISFGSPSLCPWGMWEALLWGCHGLGLKWGLRFLVIQRWLGEGGGVSEEGGVSLWAEGISTAAYWVSWATVSTRQLAQNPPGP